MFRDHEITDIKERLAAHAATVCRVLFPAGRFVDNNTAFVVGNVRGDLGDSLRVELTGAKAGMWKDFADASRPKGDMLNLIAAARRYESMGKAIVEARRLLGIPADPIDLNRVQHGTASSEDKRKKAVELWGKHQGLHGTVADAYLRGRQIDPSRLSNLGFVGKTYFQYFVQPGDDAGAEKTKRKGHAPALVARIQDLGGQLIGVHRIYLTKEGKRALFADERGKRHDKKALGPIFSGACRLQGEGTRVIIASEGIEDGGAIATALPKATVWAAPTAPHLAAMDIPEDTACLIVASDNDEEGEGAYETLRKRFADRPWLHILRARPQSKDWNLDLQTHGAEHVADAFRAVYASRAA